MDDLAPSPEAQVNLGETGEPRHESPPLRKARNCPMLMITSAASTGCGTDKARATAHEIGNDASLKI